MDQPNGGETLELLITPMVCTRVDSGNPNTCLLSDGREVIVRLPTEAEAIEMHNAARARSGDTSPIKPHIAEHIRNMVKPLPL